MRVCGIARVLPTSGFELQMRTNKKWFKKAAVAVTI